ncbi:MAG: acetolactate synthase small subunit [Selenomonadales bacterium]|nr:acetolactate synthase small subunit [Selenomonadales bacterium]
MKYVLSVLVKNEPGVLVRVASMFGRRNFNIDSLAVGVTQHPDYSRMTVVVHGDENIVEQMIKQLEKLIEVVAVELLPQKTSVQRGMALLKVKADRDTRIEILKMAEIFRAKVVDTSRDAFVFEVTGSDEKIDGFIEQLEVYGILETIRTGLISLERGSHTIYEKQKENDENGKNVL